MWSCSQKGHSRYEAKDSRTRDGEEMMSIRWVKGEIVLLGWVAPVVEEWLNMGLVAGAEGVG